jgi:hypothetical protein
MPPTTAQLHSQRRLDRGLFYVEDMINDAHLDDDEESR